MASDMCPGASDVDMASSGFQGSCRMVGDRRSSRRKLGEAARVDTTYIGGVTKKKNCGTLNCLISVWSRSKTRVGWLDLATVGGFSCKLNVPINFWSC